MHNAQTTVLLYGRTNSGKTTQIGQLAEHVYKTEGRKTRLYSLDRGGTRSIKPYIDLGIIEAVYQDDSNPWIFMNKACKGMVRDSNKKWVPGLSDDIGMFAFESLTGFSDSLMNDLAKKAGDNVNIGGGSGISFAVTGDGETLKISGNNQSHYNVTQMRITEEVWNSQRLPSTYIIWTASVSKDDDINASGKILGPSMAGKALTSEAPRWFNYTTRIDCVPAQQGKPERHILHIGTSLDQSVGNATSLGNTRTPLDAPVLPSTIEPASLVKMFELMGQGESKAMDEIKKRLGRK